VYFFIKVGMTIDKCYFIILNPSPGISGKYCDVIDLANKSFLTRVHLVQATPFHILSSCPYYLVRRDNGTEDHSQVTSPENSISEDHEENDEDALVNKEQHKKERRERRTSEKTSGMSPSKLTNGTKEMFELCPQKGATAMDRFAGAYACLIRTEGQLISADGLVGVSFKNNLVIKVCSRRLL